eukprot:1523612-Pleurochrysis_carterae.AAC.2
MLDSVDDDAERRRASLAFLESIRLKSLSNFKKPMYVQPTHATHVPLSHVRSQSQPQRPALVDAHSSPHGATSTDMSSAALEFLSTLSLFSAREEGRAESRGRDETKPDEAILERTLSNMLSKGLSEGDVNEEAHGAQAQTPPRGGS